MKWRTLVGSTVVWVGCSSYSSDPLVGDPVDFPVAPTASRAEAEPSKDVSPPPLAPEPSSSVPAPPVPSPVVLPPPARGFHSLALGYGEPADHYAHSCGVDGVGDLRCWGSNHYGQLGTGDAVSRGSSMSDAIPRVALPRPVRRVGAGSNYTCALLDDATVRCFGVYATGNGYAGFLGTGERVVLGDTALEMQALKPLDFGTGRTAEELAVGPNHACIITQGRHDILCWGGGLHGELGNGKTVNVGDDPGEMGNPLVAVDTGTASKPVQLALGFAHTCARFDNGRVKCWGYNAHGELGLGDVVERGGALATLGAALPFVDLGAEKVVRIAAGFWHTCAVLESGSAKCWGYNGYGQLGYEHVRTLGNSPAQMGGFLANVDVGSQPGSEIASIAAGETSTCALLRDGRVKCWGWANAGQLGNGDSVSRGATAGTMGLNLPDVDLGTNAQAVSVAVGISHACAMLADHRTKCWGYNVLGQLGIGDTLSRGLVRTEMGDALPAVRYP